MGDAHPCRGHQGRVARRRIDMEQWKRFLAGLVAIAAGIVYATHGHAVVTSMTDTRAPIERGMADSRHDGGPS